MTVKNVWGITKKECTALHDALSVITIRLEEVLDLINNSAGRVACKSSLNTINNLIHHSVRNINTCNLLNGLLRILLELVSDLWITLDLLND